MKKILFITLDDFSRVNSSLKQQLGKHFADYEIEEFEIKPILKKNYAVLARGVVAVFIEYFFDFLVDDDRLRFPPFPRVAISWIGAGGA